MPRQIDVTTPKPFPRALAPFTAAICVCSALAAVLLARAEGAPPLAPLVLFVALVVYSTHRDVILPNGVGVTPSTLIFSAAAVVFVDHGSLLAALIAGAAAGIDRTKLRRGSMGWIAFNAGASSIAVLAGAALLQALTPHVSTEMPWAIVGILPATTAMTVVVLLLVVLSYVIEDGRIPDGMVRELLPTVPQVLSFGPLGLLLGLLYLDLGPAVMLLIIVPILIAREMFASYLRVKESHDETVHMLIRALEAKDRYTAGHAERVARYAEYMGEQMNFGPVRMERLRFAALMHDIGKLVVPNHLLNKPGRVTASEFSRIRVHEKVSVQMLSHIDFLRPIAAASHSDMTTFDPDDPDHPIEPYIVMIADAYDAMTSTRSYRRALSQEVAFAELRDKAGIQFHPACVEALIEAVGARGEKHGAGYEEQAEFLDAPVLGVGSAGLGDLLPSEA